jgi:hypothetical protein
MAVLSAKIQIISQIWFKKGLPDIVVKTLCLYPGYDITTHMTCWLLEPINKNISIYKAYYISEQKTKKLDVYSLCHVGGYVVAGIQT